MREKDKSAYEKIMVSAAKLFAQNGYKGTTTRQIVADAGSSLSSLQNHFESKESLYRSVMIRTHDVFYKLNQPVFSAIGEMEEQGVLDENTAWNLIVELTGLIVEWAFTEEYRNEILLINGEFLHPSGVFDDMPDVILRLFRYYIKLFEKYTGKKDAYWAKILSFTVVTSLFDYANYPHILGRLLECDMNLPENRQKSKVYAKQHTLSFIRASLNAYRQE